MRRILTASLTLVTVSYMGGSVKAQGVPGFGIGTVGADPFAGYYSWFLPRQAAMASQPTVNRQLNSYMSERVSNQLSPPSSTLGGLDLSNLGIGGAAPSDLNSDQPRNPRPRLSSTGPVVENGMGRGLSRYHGRAGSYFPTMRSGSYANNGLPPTRRGR